MGELGGEVHVSKRKPGNIMGRQRRESVSEHTTDLVTAILIYCII